MIKSIISILLSIIMFASPVSVIANKSYSKANLKKMNFQLVVKLQLERLFQTLFQNMTQMKRLIKIQALKM